MEITLANFQLKAIFDLMEAMEGLHNEMDIRLLKILLTTPNLVRFPFYLKRIFLG